MSRLRYAVGIFLLTIFVRGVVLTRTSSSEFLDGRQTPAGFRSGDEGINVAVALSETGRFADAFGKPTGPTAHVPPFFPFVVSCVFRMAGYGNAAAAIRIGLALVGFGLLYASFPLAAGALGLVAESGGIAGTIAAVYPSFRSSEVFGGRDEWAAALVLLWLTVLTYKMCTRVRIRLIDTAVFGLGWGLLLHIQPSTLIVLPAHGLIFLIYSSRIAMKDRLSHGIFAAGIIALVLAPWTIRNHSALGDWVFVRDNLGLELSVSHGDGAQVSQEANQSTAWYCKVHPICSAAAVNEIRRVGEINFNRQRRNEALKWIVGHPERVITLTLARIAAFWADLPTNPSTFAVRLSCSLLCWLGLIAMWKTNYRLQALFLGSALVFYPLVYYAVQYSNRYVIPVCFAILLPAGFALHQAYLALRTGVENPGRTYRASKI